MNILHSKKLVLVKKKEATLKFLFKDQFYSLNELQEDSYFSSLQAPVMLHGNSLPNGNIVHVFEDNLRLMLWASNTKMSKEIGEILNKLPAAQRLKGEDHHWTKKKLKEKIGRIKSDIEAFSDHFDIPVNSKELHKRTTVEAPLIEGSIFKSAFLYTDRHLNGDLLPLWKEQWLPNFNWAGRNTQINSLHMWGILALFDGNWWNGSSLWLVGQDFLCNDISHYGFNERISSSIHY